MPIAEAEQIAAWLAGTDIEFLELRSADGCLTLRRQGNDVAISREGAPAPQEAAREITVTAPSVGVFLHRHPLRDAPLVRPGDTVTAGQILGLLCIGPLLLPVAAPRAGTVARMWAAHEEVVGFGSPLVELLATEGTGDHGH